MLFRSVFQKTYTTETLPFVNKANNGEKAKYYVENTNPPLISKSDFEMVQKLIKDNSLENQRKKAVTYPLTQKIRCKCGSTYKPLTVNGKKYWECTKHNLGRSKCDSRRIPEKDIYEAFVTMINKLRICRADMSDFAPYDDSGKSGTKSAFVLERGVYTVWAGADVRSCKKIAEFERNDRDRKSVV